MVDYVFADYLLKSLANYGFPAIGCLVLYFDLRKEIRNLTSAIEKKL